MLVEPRVQVNLVVDAPAPELHARHLEIGEERHADPEVGRGLLGGEAARRGEGEKWDVGRSLAGRRAGVRGGRVGFQHDRVPCHEHVRHRIRDGSGKRMARRATGDLRHR